MNKYLFALSLIASAALTAHADFIGPTFTGTQTKTIYKNGTPTTTSSSRAVTPTWQTDSSGKVLPTFSDVEVVGGNQWVTTFSNPVALSGSVAGFSLDMTVTQIGSSPKSIGQIVMYGTPNDGPCGFWPSWSSQGTEMVGDPTTFFSQTGYTVANPDGSCTWYRSATIFDANGNLIGTMTSNLTSPAPSAKNSTAK